MKDAPIRRLAVLLLAGNCLLVAIYLIHIATGETSSVLRTFFDLNGERTIPAWYSSAQLLLAGAIFLFMANTERDELPIAAWFLAAVGTGLCFLSADETVSIHETLYLYLGRFEWLPRFSGDHGLWIPIYVAGGAAFVLATARQWRALAATHRQGTAWLVAGGLLFLLGAAGIEMLSYGSLREIENRRLYTIQVAVEEAVELFGTSAMLVGSALLTTTLVRIPANPGGETSDPSDPEVRR